MIKTIVFQLFTVIGFIAFLQGTPQTPLHWIDLDIIEQIRIISGLGFMIAIGLAASVIFRSVWVKNGYAGIDKILVDKEVGLFMSHVLAFMLLEIFFFMILFYNHLQPPQYAFWICGAGFLSPEVIQGLHFIMDKFKSTKKNNE